MMTKKRHCLRHLGMKSSHSWMNMSKERQAVRDAMDRRDASRKRNWKVISVVKNRIRRNIRVR